MNMQAALSASGIAVIVLAAGRSSRMGTMKLVLPLGGRPVIAHVVAAALETPLRPVVVVLGHQAEQVRAALPDGELAVVENPAYAAGQSTSLHAGLTALPASATGAIILLGDQPLITAIQIARFAAVVQVTAAPIAATTYGGQRGNPVYFARALFPELRTVTGDEGGRAVIMRHWQDVALVDMDDPDAALDLDDSDGYARVCAVWATRHPAGV
ncbi:MAG TPA: nucleotidyltransferase family protein [Ktedonobacterales bacterium]|jgi:molybdenum cofactor cytidylyltransferase